MTCEARLGGSGGSIAHSELRVGSPLIQPAKVQSKPDALVWSGPSKCPDGPGTRECLMLGIEFAGLRQELG